MLEIIHDLAPHAALGFATADPSDAAFADNIRSLRFDAHCDIIVDDVLYFDEDPFQDGPIAKAVNNVTADGALYFSSAGNEGNTLDGTSGNFEGDFVGSGQTVGKFAGEANDFDPSSGVQVVRADLRRVQRRRAGDAVLGRPAPRRERRLRPVPVRRRQQRRRLLAGRAERHAGPVRDPVHAGLRRGRTEARRRQVLRRVAVLPDERAARPVLLGERAHGVRHARHHPRALGDHARVQRRGRAGRHAAAVRPRAGRPEEPARPLPEGVHQARRSRSGSPRTARAGCSSTRTARRSRRATSAPPAGRCGRSRTSPRPTGSRTSVDGFSPFFGTSAAAPHAAAIAALVLSGNRGRHHRRRPAGVRGHRDRPATGRRRQPHRLGHPARHPGARLHRRDPAAARQAGSGDRHPDDRRR